MTSLREDVIAILGAMDRQNAEDLSVTVALAARPGLRIAPIGIAWHCCCPFWFKMLKYTYRRNGLIVFLNQFFDNDSASSVPNLN